MSLLELKSINKLYGPGTENEVHAVKDFNLEVKSGEIVALLGSSGCGKTSTLRMIAGFEEVSSGDITIDGRKIHSLAPAKRGVAMAFEGYALYPPLSIRDNIAFALKSEKLSTSEINSRVDEIAGLLDIIDILDKRPSSTSGGQQQRASLGRALIRKAELHVLDEPMGQLEPQLRALLRGRIKHFVKENQFTVILVTHDQTEANALADRIAVMEDGVLQQFDTSSNLRNRPVNVFTGSFIGEPPMNVLSANIERDENSITLKFSRDVGLTYPKTAFSDELYKHLISWSNVIVGIRPHSVGLDKFGIPAEVIATQWLGDQTHIAIKFAGSLIVAVVHERFPSKSGDKVEISVAVDDLHLFDQNTGKAISHGGKFAWSNKT